MKGYWQLEMRNLEVAVLKNWTDCMPTEHWAFLCAYSGPVIMNVI